MLKALPSNSIGFIEAEIKNNCKIITRHSNEGFYFEQTMNQLLTTIWPIITCTEVIFALFLEQ